MAQGSSKNLMVVIALVVIALLGYYAYTSMNVESPTEEVPLDDTMPTDDSMLDDTMPLEGDVLDDSAEPTGEEAVEGTVDAEVIAE